VHRRNRRHPGREAAGRGDHRERHARRDRVPRKPAPAAALLEGLDETALERVYEERLRLSPGAERMLERLRSLKIKTLLVSSGFTFFTERLKGRLSLDYTLSNTLEIKNGKLTGKVVGRIVDAQTKAAKLCELRDGLRLSREQVIVIGDGANDLAMMAEAGVSIAYHAKP